MFEIGNSLREARVRQGLDFPQVELATKIRAKYMRALEDEQFEILPSETYVKGFLRSYAEYLGLDGQLYVDEYNSRYVVERRRRPRAAAPPRACTRSRGLERKVVLLALVGDRDAHGARDRRLEVRRRRRRRGDARRRSRRRPQRRRRAAGARGSSSRARHAARYVEVHRSSADRASSLFQGTLGAGDVQRSSRQALLALHRHAGGPRRRSSGGRQAGSTARAHRARAS